MIVFVVSTGLGLLVCAGFTMFALTLRDRRSPHYRGPWRILGQLAGDSARARPVVAGIFTGWLVVIGASIAWDLTRVRDSPGLATVTAALVFVAWTLIAVRAWRITRRKR